MREIVASGMGTGEAECRMNCIYVVFEKLIGCLFSLIFVQIALDRMAVTIQAVVDNCKRLVTDENEALFLEMLADLIRDIDHVSF